MIRLKPWTRHVYRLSVTSDDILYLVQSGRSMPTKKKSGFHITANFLSDPGTSDTGHPHEIPHVKVRQLARVRTLA